MDASVKQTGHQKMANDPIELRLERTFDAPRDLVFQAWADPEQMKQWWGPEGFTLPFCEMDVKAGGAYRCCMKEPDGAEHWVQGVYEEITAPEKIVFSWAWEEDGIPGHVTTVTVEFFENGDKTDLVLVHSGFESEESSQGHNQGWTSSFDKLATLLTT